MFWQAVDRTAWEAAVPILKEEAQEQRLPKADAGPEARSSRSKVGRRVDPNEGWSAFDARRALRELESVGLEQVEEPIDMNNVAAMGKVFDLIDSRRSGKILSAHSGGRDQGFGLHASKTSKTEADETQADVRVSTKILRR